ncbi:hypothetical protein K2173_018448 [Erythroxylum novogranatense]|uniref:CRIB domain-containing protein n=1 Tax=Erythroxylum novogranatense TaxID=1862640 RepID=A0AAV8UAL2_9ROSI|nr:hypothetical protein K2173_018448 [Erythroxylum novogranatense]
MSNNKMKGLLKGLRYISQIFENEKDGEMHIGFPTDVKHVAHIGWDDGPSVNQPSWMNEYKGPPGLASSAPLNVNGEMEDAPVKWVSQANDSGYSTGEGDTGSPSRDRDAELSKPSRLRSSAASRTDESSTTEKTKQRRPSKHTGTRELPDGAKPTRHPKDPTKGGESASNPSDIPKKIRRRKPKEEESTRSRSKAHAPDSDAVSVLKSNDNELGHSSLEESADKGCTGIS